MSDTDTDVISVVLYSVFSALNLFSNIIVIIVIIKSKDLHLPTLWNIAVMAAWDLASGLHCIVFIVPSKIMNAFAYPDACATLSAITFKFIIAQNMMNIVVALVDRYISISWPMHYPRLMSARRFAFAVISVFLLNIVLLSFSLLTVRAYVYINYLGFHVTTDKTNNESLLKGVFPLLISFSIIALLIKIRFELGRKRQTTNTGGTQTNTSQFTYTMYLSTLTYIVFYVPTAVSFVVTFIQGEDSYVMMKVGYVFSLCSNLCNVFIYAATYRPFRDAFLKLFFPTYFRERARREVQVLYQRDRSRVQILTVESLD